jgi:large subunit ribosomal protein L1
LSCFSPLGLLYAGGAELQESDVLKALEELDKAKKRNFVQTYELIVNFKGLDLKSPDSRIDIKVDMPHPTGKGSSQAVLFAKTKVFAEELSKDFDWVIMEDEIPKLGKQDIKKLLDYDILLAEGPVMVSVGKHLGQKLAPRNKMPKPVPAEPDAARKMLESLKGSVRITNKKGKGIPLVQVVVGTEKMPKDQIVANVLTVYNEIERALPGKRANVKSVYIKKTMSPAVRIW